jgi:Carboxypeptidase regulatory-like domain
VTTLPLSILFLTLIAQSSPARPARANVIDGDGKPVANARVVLYAPPVAYLKGDPVEVEAKTGADGQFSLVIPPLERAVINGISVVAYAPGLAIGATSILRGARIVLQAPQPRTVKVEGPDGQPIAGARVALRVLYAFGGTLAEIPQSLADSLAITTGPDGSTSIGYLAARDQLVAVRITADSIGSQDFVLVEQPGRGSEPPVITIKLKTTYPISGRLVDETARPVADQVVELWSRGNGSWLVANQVGFKEGPPKTNADGSFRTPANLQHGSAYRVAIRAPGKDPIFSDWITIQDKPQTLPLLVQRSLRTIRGKLVDRQGKPVAGALVFQSGDGPERTEITTGADGHFSLSGFRPGPVFLLVRKDGFRLHGQLIKATDVNVAAELTRESEPPSRSMKTLPDVITIDESRALARQLLEPCWKVLEGADDPKKGRFLEALVPADPAGVLDKLATLKFTSESWRFFLLQEIVLALAERDQEEAASVAESIPDPATRSLALAELSDRLPKSQRERKLALLDRALQQARITAQQTDRLARLGDVALRLSELGQTDKAKALFAEGSKIASQLTDKTDFKRGIFAARLALVDLPAAEKLARDFKGNRSEARVVDNMAFMLAQSRPDDAERLWRRIATSGRSASIWDGIVGWKLARVDPPRALRVLDTFRKTGYGAAAYFYLALGARTRDESISRQAFQTGLHDLDQMIEERPESYPFEALTSLPVVEATDPALVPEVLWRHVASRLPYGNPRALLSETSALQIAEIAYYDRPVAAALLEPTLVRMEHASPDHLAHWPTEFVAWSLIDPRAAVARLEKIPVAQDTDLHTGANSARFAVGASLARSRLERWRARHDEREIIFGGKRNF